MRFGLPALVFVVAFGSFQPALSGDWAAVDDIRFLVEVPNWRGLSGTHVSWMFTTFEAGHFQPLAWITLALDHGLWGMNPLGYHLTNLVLHGASAVVLYLLILVLLRDSGLPASLAAVFGALVWGAHPLRTESAAWITERRDVLSGLFLLLCVLAYVRMQSGEGQLRTRLYVASIACLALSLLSKAWGMTLPVVLLVLDVWPLQRTKDGGWKRCLVEKIPYALLSAVAAGLAITAQRTAGATLTFADHSMFERLLQAAYGLCFYVVKTLAPTNLCAFYLIEERLHLAGIFALAVVAVIVVTAGLIVKRRQVPALVCAAACYVIVVSPVLGLAQSGQQLVADRYSYLACIAWSPVLAWGALQISRRAGVRFTIAAACVVVVTLSFLSMRQAEVWRDSLTLLTRVIEVQPRNFIALRWRGSEHYKQRDKPVQGMAPRESYEAAVRRAIADFDRSIALTDLQPSAFVGRGLARFALGDRAGAIADYTHALTIGKRTAETLTNRGVAYKASGDPASALSDFEEAVRVDPLSAAARANRGLIRIEMKDAPGALEDLSTALKLNPSYFPAYVARASLLESRGELGAAMADYERALGLAPPGPTRTALERSADALRRKLGGTK